MCKLFGRAALIHDADHRGVSNMQLAKEDEAMADLYKNKSIAEQHSLDTAWNLLMEDRFTGLRSTLFVDRTEMMRFRQGEQRDNVYYLERHFDNS
jgi:3'5'-cyclic nucleotide phosphodiesterase